MTPAPPLLSGEILPLAIAKLEAGMRLGDRACDADFALCVKTLEELRGKVEEKRLKTGELASVEKIKISLARVREKLLQARKALSESRAASVENVKILERRMMNLRLIPFVVVSAEVGEDKRAIPSASSLLPPPDEMLLSSSTARRGGVVRAPNDEDDEGEDDDDDDDTAAKRLKRGAISPTAAQMERITSTAATTPTKTPIIPSRLSSFFTGDVESSLVERMISSPTNDADDESEDNNHHHSTIVSSYDTFAFVINALYRLGCFETAKAAVEGEKCIENDPWAKRELLSDLEQFKQMHEIRLSLLQASPTPKPDHLLGWISENRANLKRLKSKLEFDVRLRQYLDIVLHQRDATAATAFARKHLASHYSQNMEIVKRAMGCLTFVGAPHAASPYAEGLGSLPLGKTWSEIAENFVQVWYACRQLTSPHHHHHHHHHHHPHNRHQSTHSPLRTLILAGVSSLATKSCRRVLTPLALSSPGSPNNNSTSETAANGTPNNNSDEDSSPTSATPAMMMMLRNSRGTPPLSHASLPACPTCRPGFHELSLAVPRTNHELSRVVCRITGQPMDDVLVLPNGEAFSRLALERAAANNNGNVVCPVTKQVFRLKDARRAFVL